MLTSNINEQGSMPRLSRPTDNQFTSLSTLLSTPELNVPEHRWPTFRTLTNDLMEQDRMYGSQDSTSNSSNEPESLEETVKRSVAMQVAHRYNDAIIVAEHALVMRLSNQNSPVLSTSSMTSSIRSAVRTIDAEERYADEEYYCFSHLPREVQLARIGDLSIVARSFIEEIERLLPKCFNPFSQDCPQVHLMLATFRRLRELQVERGCQTSNSLLIRIVWGDISPEYNLFRRGVFPASQKIFLQEFTDHLRWWVRTLARWRNMIEAGEPIQTGTIWHPHLVEMYLAQMNDMEFITNPSVQASPVHEPIRRMEQVVQMDKKKLVNKPLVAVPRVRKPVCRLDRVDWVPEWQMEFLDQLLDTNEEDEWMLKRSYRISARYPMNPLGEDIEDIDEYYGYK